MTLIFLGVAGFLLVFSVTFRCAVMHSIKLVRNAVIDAFTYVRQRKFNNCRTGELLAYVGLFGRGKTLSIVHRVVGNYVRYNDKLVWCPRRKKLVTQNIKVLSNVSLQIPYEQFVSLEQIILCAEKTPSWMMRMTP